MPFCKYRHIFGKEGEGVHSLRIFNIAIVDLALTFVAAYIIGFYTKWSILLTFVVLMVLSVFVHKLFCVESTLTKMIFP